MSDAPSDGVQKYLGIDVCVFLFFALAALCRNSKECAPRVDREETCEGGGGRFVDIKYIAT